MFPKMGKTFPKDEADHVSRYEYSEAISAALVRELGNSHRAIKTLMKWTGANERTAKNWLSGANGPSGQHLVEMLKHSDQLVFTIAELTGRQELGIVVYLCTLKLVLGRLTTSLDGVLEDDRKT